SFCFFLCIPPHPRSTFFPYTTLFRSQQVGVCVLDPHGELIDHVLARLDNKDVDKVAFLDLANYHYPFGLNLFTCADLTNPFEVQDRKSTRLNSSHVAISYAVFCLKKK